MGMLCPDRIPNTQLAKYLHAVTGEYQDLGAVEDSGVVEFDTVSLGSSSSHLFDLLSQKIQ